MHIRKAVIPAAGMGTRFLPATKAQPKEMLPLVDTPIIQLVVQEAISAGIDEILIVTGRGKRAIEDHFDRSPELELLLSRTGKEELLSVVRQISEMANVHFVRQKEPLGLGDAIYQARRFVGDEPFAVLLGDEIFCGPVPCLTELAEVHERLGGSVLAVQEVPLQAVERYGVIKPEALGEHTYRAVDLVEKPPRAEAPSTLAITGRYILDPAIFPVLESLPPGRNGEIQLTDALRVLNGSKPVYAYVPSAQRYDVGDRLGYLIASLEMALARPELADDLQAYLLQLVDRLGASVER